MLLSSIALDNGTLSITLAANESNLALVAVGVGDSLQVEIDWAAVGGTFLLSAINQITIDGNENPNSFDLSGVPQGSVDPITVNTYGGNDTVIASMSQQIINGGAGDDVLLGGGQQDSLTGASGADLLLGNGGNDTLTGQTRVDTQIGGAGNDTILDKCADGSAECAEKPTAIPDFLRAMDSIDLTTNIGTNDIYDTTSPATFTVVDLFCLS